MDFPYKRENLRLLLIKMGFKFTRRGRNSLIHERQDLIAERAISFAPKALRAELWTLAKQHRHSCPKNHRRNRQKIRA